jgi:polyribonucleotide nucleotidyltransferase
MKQDGTLVFDPSFEDEKDAKISILVAGTLDAITMVESEAKEVSDAEMMTALKRAHEIIKEFCHAQIDFVKLCEANYGKNTVKEFYNLPNEELYDKVAEYLTEEKLEALYNVGKKEFQHVLDDFDIEVRDHLLSNNIVAIPEGKTLDEVKASMTYVGAMVYKRVKKVMRKNVIEKELRLDGRKMDEVRAVIGEVGLLPRTHGSALFRRGMTSALSIATL